MIEKDLIVFGDNQKILNDKIIADYANKIKVIYIDPPYNTQTSKSYNDKILHDTWLENIKKCLILSYKYLKEDGLIFISIDDNEYAYLKILCDDIFGKCNFIGTFITQQSKRSNSKLINVVHEYVLCFAKNKSKIKKFKIKRIDVKEYNDWIVILCKQVKNFFINDGYDIAYKYLHSEIKRICKNLDITWLKNYSNIDDSGNIYFAKDLSTPSKPRKVEIPSINLFLEPLKTRGWSSDNKFIKLYNENKLVFKANRPYEKHLLLDAEDNVSSILNFYSRQGTNDLNKLNLRGLFDTPKPVNLIKFLINLVAEKNDIIMDYFAGSGTTAQAVYEINLQYGLDLHYLLIQLNEQINPKSDIYKNCIKYRINPNMSEILKLRINTFLKQNNLDQTYIIKEFYEEPTIRIL